MIRFIMIVFVLVLFLVISIPLLIVFKIISLRDPLRAAQRAQSVVRFMFRLLLRIAGVEAEVRGEENIPEEGGVLFVSNHRSYFDILIGYAYTPKLLGFVAKSEMDRYPLLRDWMRLVNCLFLDRKDMKKGLKTILEGIDKIRRGISIWICPEGTRLRAESSLEMADFKEGSLKIAEKSGCPVIPVAISGSYEIFEKQIPAVRPAHAIIEYGKPVNLAELSAEDRKKSGAYTREIILDMLKNTEKDYDRQDKE